MDFGGETNLYTCQALGSHWRVKDDQDLAHTLWEVAERVKDLIQM